MKSAEVFDIELKIPDESAPLYTAEDYMRDTDNGNRKDYDLMLKEAEARGQGFGFTYMRAIEKSVRGHGKAWEDYNKIRKDAADYRVNVNFEKTGELLNSVLETTYRDAAADMQLYIIEKGGVIDCWPDAKSASTFDFYNVRKDGEKNDTAKVSINYFSSKIQKKSDENGSHYYRPSEPFYRNACPYISSPEMKNMEKKINELNRVRVYKKGEKFKNNARHIIVALPVILSIICALLMIFWRITGTDVDAFMNGINWTGLGTIGSILLFIPLMLLFLTAAIYPFLESTVALIIGVVAFVIVGFVGYGAMNAMISTDSYWISKKAVKRGEEAQNELQALKESDEYKRIIEENVEYLKSQRQLSDKWHKAWFERVKHRFYYI